MGGIFVGADGPLAIGGGLTGVAGPVLTEGGGAVGAGVVAGGWVVGAEELGPLPGIGIGSTKRGGIGSWA
jgi:hypothetical protein